MWDFLLIGLLGGHSEYDWYFIFCVGPRTSAEILIVQYINAIFSLPQFNTFFSRMLTESDSVISENPISILDHKGIGFFSGKLLNVINPHFPDAIPC